MSGSQFKELSVKRCKNGFLVKEPTAFSEEYVFNHFDGVQHHLYNFFDLKLERLFLLEKENIFWQSFSVFYNPISENKKYRIVQYFDGSTIVNAKDCSSLEECIKIIIKGNQI